MSRHYNLYANLVEVEKGNREDLLRALEFLSDNDCDFNGENGIKYAWEETKENGFESNLEYLLNEVKDIKDDKECVDKFINTWMENDSNYYHSYEINYLIDEDKKIYAISLATMSGW